MTNKELGNAIRKELKAEGITSKDVSVRVRDSLYDTVVNIEIKNPKIRKSKVQEIAKKYEAVEHDESWLDREKLGRKILIHPGVCIKETDVYNQSVLDDLKKKKYVEYNLSGSDLDTKYNFNSRFDCNITI